MRKFRYLMPMLLVVAMTLAACGGGSPTAAPEPTEAPAAAAPTEAPAAAAPTEAPAAEPTAAPTEAPAAEVPAAEPTEAPVAEAPMAGEWTCPEGDQTVSLWHGWQGEYFTNIEAIFNEYMALCPNVKVELLQKPDMNNAVVAAVPAGEGPDIIAWVNDQIGRHAETEVIVPLDDYIDAAKFESAFIPTAVNAMKYAGKTWCYPESMEAIMMIYNKDLISEADLPTTTDELLEKAAAWKEANPDSYYFVFARRTTPTLGALRRYGVTIVDGSTRPSPAMLVTCRRVHQRCATSCRPRLTTASPTRCSRKARLRSS
jgi:arabinogalactan oligomer/maltooligosaccharide transport system substrate-binding protein